MVGRVGNTVTINGKISANLLSGLASVCGALPKSPLSEWPHLVEFPVLRWKMFLSKPATATSSRDGPWLL